MQKIKKKYSMINTKKFEMTIVFSILLITICLIPTGSFAQKDTIKKKSTIDINSVYKPVLRNAVKINFSATHLTPILPLLISLIVSLHKIYFILISPFH